MGALADLVDARRERRRALREELRSLEQGFATPEMRRAAHREALRNERAGVVQRLVGLERVADAQRVEVPYVPPHEWPSAGERRAQLE